MFRMHGWHGGGHGRTRGWGPAEVAFESFGPSGRRGGRRRMFDGGELRLVLLKLIEEQPRHGYDLIREIEERTGGGYAPSPGVIYPTVTLLADMGLIGEQEADGPRKVFAITAAGSTHLVEREEEVAALLARLSELGAAHERGRTGPVRRAMGNLRAVLHGAMEGAAAHPDRQHDIAAILDEAARRIERLGR